MTNDIVKKSDEARHRYRGFVRYVDEDKDYGYIDQKTIEPLENAPQLKSPDGEGIYIRERDCDRPLRVGMELTFQAVPDYERKKCFRALGATETTDSRLKGMTEGGIAIGIPDRELQDPSFFVTWCLDVKQAGVVKDWLLKNYKVKLLIIQFRLTGDEENPTADEKRQIVNLKDELAALSFESSGKQRIVMVPIAAKEQNRLKDVVLATTNDRYQTSLISSDGSCLIGDLRDSMVTGSIDVEIPAALFAEKPRHYDFVNSFYTVKKPKDECRFFWRRVAIYALHVVRGPWIAVKIVLKSVIGAIAALVLLGLGMRGLNYRMFRHPYYTPLKYVWEDLQGSRFARKKNGRHFILPFTFSPTMLIVAAILIYFFTDHGGEGFLPSPEDAGLYLVHVAISMAWVVGTFIAIGAALYWAEGVNWGEKASKADNFFADYFARWDERKRKARNEKYAREAEEEARQKVLRREQLERDVRDLICTTTGPRTPDAKRLPFTPKTIYFKVLDWKWKRCRNFSK